VPLKESDEGWVIEQIRRPRLYLGMIAGAGLALAGMTFQAVFRNPLATPFTLGVSSGASLALAIGLALGVPASAWGGASQAALAFAGAMVVVLCVYAVAQLRRGSSTTLLLLAGVCVNFICGAGIILVQYLLADHEAKQIIIWLIGSVEATGRPGLPLLAGLMALGAAVLMVIHRDLDLLMMGELVAASRGVDVRRSRGIAYFCASLMTAVVVSACGPIAFVGLLVPHTMRLLAGPTHRVLAPACLLFGMAFLPICDTLARNFLGWVSDRYYAELPVGVVTNVLGGVFFLVVLIRQRADQPIMS
jgi:iron complex transport system permease protein